MKQFLSIPLIRASAMGFVFSFLSTCAVIAQPDALKPSDIVATVNDKTISAGQLHRALAKSVGKVKLSKEQSEVAKKAILEQIIHQHVVLDFLESHQSGAGKNQIIERMDELKAQLATVDKTLEQYLEETGKSQAELEFELAWQLAWQKYLDRKLTDKALEAHYNEHKRRFDGTELRVAHLLLKPERSGSQTDAASRVDAAKQIFDSIKSGKLSWEQAVEKHSQAPTRDSAGVIGWIKQSGPMPKPFTTAAFELNLNEISRPVVTTFGVHLIRCIEIKEGKIGWRDNIKAVQADAMRVIFEAIVAKHRAQTKIQYAAQFSE